MPRDMPQELQLELSELSGRIARLRNFLESDFILETSMEETALLEIQLVTMEAYARVLRRRIDLPRGEPGAACVFGGPDCEGCE